MKKPYQISTADATASAALAQFTKANGQFLLPLVDLITDARLAVDTVIEQLGRQTIETILKLSAQEVAGAPTPGKARGEGRKHVLGIERGATENAAAVKRLLTHLRDHGLATEPQYLFVIDGAKALRAAIDEVFGTKQPVQRCRNHKLRNVIDELPKDQHTQAMNLMRAAWKLRTAEEGEQRLEQLARFLEASHESAARSLREGLAEMFTLQRLKIPPSLHKCLATTNLIESPQGGVQKRTANVTRWRDQDMAERWVASAWLETEKKFRRISGHQDLCSLAAILGRETVQRPSQKERVA